MNKQYLYTAWFVSREELLRALEGLVRRPLCRETEAPHVTHEFRPARVDPENFGKPVEIVITGYGNDGENEGLRVELRSEDPVIAELIRSVSSPHITLSISETGQAVNTGRIDFLPVEPVRLTGVFGALDSSGEIVTESK